MESSTPGLETLPEGIKSSARKYLITRSNRRYIEKAGGKIDAFPRRVVEIIRSRRLASRLGLNFENQDEIDDGLPRIAQGVTGLIRTPKTPEPFDL